MSRGSAIPDASQIGRQFEALARLEWLLRLNGYTAEANSHGLAIRTDINEIRKEVAAAGVALGLFLAEYRRVSTTGLAKKSQIDQACQTRPFMTCVVDYGFVQSSSLSFLTRWKTRSCV